MKRRVSSPASSAEEVAVSSLSPHSPPDSDDDDPVDDLQARSSAAVGAVSLPPAFLSWLSAHNLSPLIYTLALALPRYVRLNPRRPAPLTTLEAELGALLQPTSLASVYAVPSSTALASSAPYKAGQLYGIDLASALAVHALGLPSAASRSSLPLHVLDLCAAPGAKLAFMYDLLAASGRAFTLTGVDVSAQRLSACRNAARKYDLRGVRLCLADGRSFDQPPPDSASSSSSAFVIHDLTTAVPGLRLNKRQKRVHRRAVARHPPALPDAPPPPPPSASPTAGLYQRVLVDAECSHDASVRHMLRSERSGWATFERRFLGAERLDALQALQRALLARGWRLLEEGGVLVYSVCSGLREQGEDIVEWLIDSEGGGEGGACMCPVFEEGEAEEVSDGAVSAQLPPDGAATTAAPLSVSSTGKWRWKRGRPFLRLSVRQEAVRMDPAVSGTSGLFIAKLRKRPRHATQ